MGATGGSRALGRDFLPLLAFLTFEETGRETVRGEVEILGVLLPEALQSTLMASSSSESETRVRLAAPTTGWGLSLTVLPVEH